MSDFTALCLSGLIPGVLLLIYVLIDDWLWRRQFRRECDGFSRFIERTSAADNQFYEDLANAKDDDEINWLWARHKMRG